MDLPTLEDIQLEMRRRCTLAEFVQESWHVLEPTTPLVWGWHMEALCTHVEAMLDGWAASQSGGPPPAQQNAIIAIPPGSSKSRVVSVCATAWRWIRHPSARVQAVSGNPRVAMRDSVYCRDLILSDWYQQSFEPAWELKEDQNAKGQFNNTAGGFRKAIGAGARITGDRADITVVDDPLDAADRFSATARHTVNDWWDSAAASRVNDPQRSIRMLIAQRLHEDDLTGHILKTEPDAWERLIIPQEWEESQRHTTWLGWTDPRTADGQLMCAERFPGTFVAAEKRRLGSAGYAAQHQQRPAPEAGGIFQRDWFKRTAVVPPLDFTIHSWDPRNSLEDKEGTSFVVGLCLGVKGPDVYVLDERRGRYSPLETEQQAADAHRKWVGLYGPCRALLMEQKASGPGAIERLRKTIPAVLGILPKGSKEERAAWVSPAVQAGNVFVCDGAWSQDFLDELCSFPFGANNDRVDTLTQGLQWLQGAGAYAGAAAIVTAPKRAGANVWAMGGQQERGGRWRIS